MHSYVGTGYRFRRGVKCGLIAYKVPPSKKKKIIYLNLFLTITYTLNKISIYQ